MTECSHLHGAVKGKRSRHAGVDGKSILFSYAVGPKPTLTFDAESVTSDAGLAAMRELDERIDLTLMAARFVDDLRNPDLVVHPVVRLIREAVYAYAAGYEDANDHPMLAGDAYFLSLIGPTNQKSVNPKRHDGLASEASLSRLLNARALNFDRLSYVHAEAFARVVKKNPPEEITLDIDSYDAETYGGQQLSLFNGYYREEMYHPLVVTVAEYGFVVAGLLRPGNAGPSGDADKLMQQLLSELRRLLPNTRIKLRADSGFVSPPFYRVLEKYGVKYAIRLRLTVTLKKYFEEVFPDAGDDPERRSEEEGWPLYHRRDYRPKGWHKSRRIIMKIQRDPKWGSLERFVILTNMRGSNRRVWNFYEHRGQCEQRIDELKNHLRAEKFSCCEFAANAVKLHLILMAHNLFAAVRIMLPEKHELKRATVQRLRVALIKCGATVVRTARRLWIHASRSWPNRKFLADIARRFTSGHFYPTPLWHAG